MKFYAVVFICLICFIGLSQSPAVSCSCTIYSTQADTLPRVIASNQVFCIRKNAVYKGNITLSGGTICNEGYFFPDSIVCVSGMINNNNMTKIKHASTVNNNITLNNSDKGVFTFAGNFTIQGTVNNHGRINVKGNIAFINGQFNNYAIVNCNQVTGGSGINNQNGGIINHK